LLNDIYCVRQAWQQVQVLDRQW